MTWTNLMMYNAVRPSYDFDKKEDGEPKSEEVIKADDPANRNAVRKILFDE